MFYFVYLVIVTLYTALIGIGGQNLFSHFFDGATLIFVLLPCIVVLFCTGQLKAFGRSFLLIFGKKSASVSECRESAASVKTAGTITVIFGMMGFIIGMINGLSSVSHMASDMEYGIARDAAVALVSPFYASVVCAALLPLYFIIKKRIIALEK